MSDAKLKAMMDRRIVQLWVVEFVYYVNGEKYWKPTEDKTGEYNYFNTRKEALEQKDLSYHGHEKDLRVKKFVREDNDLLKVLQARVKALEAYIKSEEECGQHQVTSANAGY